MRVVVRGIKCFPVTKYILAPCRSSRRRYCSHRRVRACSVVGTVLVICEVDLRRGGDDEVDALVVDHREISGVAEVEVVVGRERFDGLETVRDTYGLGRVRTTVAHSVRSLVRTALGTSNTTRFARRFEWARAGSNRNETRSARLVGFDPSLGEHSALAVARALVWARAGSNLRKTVRAAHYVALPGCDFQGSNPFGPLRFHGLLADARRCEESEVGSGGFEPPTSSL